MEIDAECGWAGERIRAQLPVRQERAGGQLQLQFSHLHRAVVLPVGRVDRAAGRDLLRLRGMRCRTLRGSAHAQVCVHGYGVRIAFYPRGQRGSVQARVQAQALERRHAHHAENRVQGDVFELRNHLAVHRDGHVRGMHGKMRCGMG